MTLPPRKPRFVLPVSGARVGSLARPQTDGATERERHAVGAPSRARFGLRAHVSPLAADDRPPAPGVTGKDGEVA